MHNSQFSLSCDKRGEKKALIKKEWLESNGLGSFAMGTLALAHTRKYHSFFNLSRPLLNKKFNILSKVILKVEIDGISYDLDTNFYSNKVYPQGIQYQTAYHCTTHPHFVYTIGNIQLTLELLFLHERESLILAYSFTGGAKKTIVRIVLAPAYPIRELHSLSTFQNSNHSAYESLNSRHQKIRLAPFLSDLEIVHSQDISLRDEPKWLFNLHYTEELRRGEEGREDIYVPAEWSVSLTNKQPYLLAFTFDQLLAPLDVLYKNEIVRRNSLLDKAKKNHNHFLLAAHVDQYLIKRPDGHSSIIAGYPWFDEWTRDSLLSVPGLCFEQSDFARGLDIIEHTLTYEKNGLLPTQLPIGGKSYQPFYNSIDTSFLPFWTLQMYILKSGDMESVHRKFKSLLGNIIRAFIQGRVPIAEVHPSGLIWSGEESTCYTWMDANPGFPVTSRSGYAVEINALWYNALCFYLELIDHRPEDHNDYLLSRETIKELIATLKSSFRRVFWSEHFGFLSDVVDNSGSDYTVRPNQIFAVSLPYSPLTMQMKIGVVKTVKDHLLTPQGLHSLSPHDPNYVGRYQGDRLQRDRAYHQGTIWPWLVGPFVDAALKVVKNRASCALYLSRYFHPLISTHLKEGGVLGISEIFDGEAHDRKARGAPFQAWSLAEIIRTYNKLDSILAKPTTKKRKK